MASISTSLNVDVQSNMDDLFVKAYMGALYENIDRLTIKEGVNANSFYICIATKENEYVSQYTPELDQVRLPLQTKGSYANSKRIRGFFKELSIQLGCANQENISSEQLQSLKVIVNQKMDAYSGGEWEITRFVRELFGLGSKRYIGTVQFYDLLQNRIKVLQNQIKEQNKRDAAAEKIAFVAEQDVTGIPKEPSLIKKIWNKIFGKSTDNNEYTDNDYTDLGPTDQRQPR